jgi:ADP-ribose pyrophosphatase YjhB (NUDIX family)
VGRRRPAAREQHRPQVWALPKGPDRRGERGLETASARSTRRPASTPAATASSGDVRYVYTWEGERVFKVVSFFLLRAVGGRIGDLPPGMEIEVAEARWVPLDDAPTVLSYGGEREMAVRALEAVTRKGFASVSSG